MSSTRFIKKESITDITDSNIIEVISHYVNLQKSGTSYKALSPFTEEKTPSFIVATVGVIILTLDYGRPPWISFALAISWSSVGSCNNFKY